MSILVRQAFIKDPLSPHNQKVKDIYIEKGYIQEIGDQLNIKADHVIDFPHQHVSPGWVDMYVTGTDPGFEFKDTLETTALSAATGGFTHVFLSPNSKPVVQNKTAVEYVIGKSLPVPVRLHPIGAISKNTEGAELTEMHEMNQSGAIAFGDGAKAVQSAGLFIKALQYVNAFDGVIIQIPDDRSIAPHGLMNEGIVSTRVGLPGKPSIAEELMVSRDIALAKYTGSNLHITGITLASSVDMIRKAKQEGLRISCSCTPYHLVFTDNDLLTGYDTNLKVNPPLRSQADQLALIQGIKDGTIDCIASHHTAQHKDAKVCEFEYAGYGMLGLETMFSLLVKAGLTEDEILTSIVHNPRKLFRLPGSIQIGMKADLTTYSLDQETIYHADFFKSKSANSPFIGKHLKGKIHATILGDQSYQIS